MDKEKDDELIHFGGKVKKPRSPKQTASDNRLRWMSYKRARVEELQAFQDDFRHEVNIDPFIDDLAPDPLIDELGLPPVMLRTTRGDYLPYEIWNQIQPTESKKL